ncbi:MAG: adenylyl-sulfate kinase [Mariprofundaceae bacterium]|nr:adenylyl-sulfate kinase [Mariprofundaceae bacterium]
MNDQPIYWQENQVGRQQREALHHHQGAVLWFTGLSGAGKSTLANAVEIQLHKMGVNTFILDGDNIRHGLCSDLDFSDQGRGENIRRIGEVSKLFVDAGTVVLTAFISPFREDRKTVRSLLGAGDFIEVYCDCSINVCEERDVKGLYKRARAGEISDFTGIDSPYEAPLNPELHVDTGTVELALCVDRVIAKLQTSGVIPASSHTIL